MSTTFAAQQPVKMKREIVETLLDSYCRQQTGDARNVCALCQDWLALEENLDAAHRLLRHLMNIDFSFSSEEEFGAIRKMVREALGEPEPAKWTTPKELTG